MSVQRQANILGQQRLDVPHLRAIESSISADFDLLAGTIMAGDKPLVVRGFEVVTSGAIGNPATSLQLSVAGGVVLHPLASEHGTIFAVAANQPVEVLSSTNSRVSGSFTANQVNYVGLDLRRIADPSTADLVMFLDANTLLETPKSVPLARVLQYRIVISTTDFSSTPHLLPLAKVTTNNVNTVATLEDARPMAFRLAGGGSVPNRYSTFTWPAGRAESTTGAIFSGGDKAVGSLKDWMDAIMTRLWELGGGQYWYSAASDREVKLLFGQPVIPATSDNFQWVLGTNTLTWSGLSVAFGNSPVASNSITAGSATLIDGQCLYADIDRTSVAALVPHVGDLTTLGTPTIPGSRLVIAWRLGNQVYIKDKSYEVGRAMAVATTTVYGVVRLKYAAGTSTDPRVLAENANGSYTNTASANNAPGFSGTGHGTGVGVLGTGGGTNGVGVRGVGVGTGAAVEGTAASATAPAFKAVVGIADFPVIDRAGTIDIGTTSATGTTIGRSGQVVTIQGTANIATLDRAGTINIGTASTTGVTVGRTGQTTTVNGTLAAATIDVAATLINIGTATATTVSIGRTGQTLNLNGGTANAPGVWTFNGGAGCVKFKAGGTLDHIYTEFYARSSAQNTRSGFLGYSGAGSNTLALTNEIASGSVDITPGTGGVVNIGRSGGTVAVVGNTTVNGSFSATTINGGTWITVGSGGVTMGTGYLTPSGYAPIAVRLTPWGDLEFRGSIGTGTAGTGSYMINLPVGLRPSVDRYVMINSTANTGSWARIKIVASNGDLFFEQGYLNTDSIYFFDNVRVSM